MVVVPVLMWSSRGTRALNQLVIAQFDVSHSSGFWIELNFPKNSVICMSLSLRFGEIAVFLPRRNCLVSPIIPDRRAHVREWYTPTCIHEFSNNPFSISLVRLHPGLGFFFFLFSSCKPNLLSLEIPFLPNFVWPSSLRHNSSRGCTTILYLLSRPPWAFLKTAMLPQMTQAARPLQTCQYLLTPKAHLTSTIYRKKRSMPLYAKSVKHESRRHATLVTREK